MLQALSLYSLGWLYSAKCWNSANSRCQTDSLDVRSMAANLTSMGNKFAIYHSRWEEFNLKVDNFDKNGATLIARFRGATWSPRRCRQDPSGSHVGPMNRAIWEPTLNKTKCTILCTDVSSQVYVTRWLLMINILLLKMIMATFQ